VNGPPEGEGDNLWNRLRRRKVVQWGIAYAAGAWGFLQGLAYVSSLLNWPAKLQKLTGLALLIGLPVALVLAWYHGDKGHRRVTRTELAILTGLFLLGGGLFWRYQHATESPTPAAATAAERAPAATPPVTAARPNEKSIAVLPFVDMSAEKNQEYMSDGMAEELLNLLAHVPDLKVIARTSSFAFKGKDVDIAEIAKKLNVAHVLEGSVRTSGDKIRVTAQLIRTADSTHLWSETYDRPLDDIFAVQDEIADAIAQALQIKLEGGALERREGGTQSLEAYRLYLLSESALYQNTQSALDAAGKYLEQAIKLDPNYGLAWSRLGDVVAVKTDNGYLGVAEGYGRARQLAQHALQLSPDLAAAHSTLQYVYQTLDWDWTAAKAEQQRALAIDPTSPWALQTAGLLSITLGQWNEAEHQLSESLSRDPLNTYTILNLGQAYYLSGRFEEAEGAFRKLLELEPGFMWARRWLGKTLLAQNKPDEALATVQQEFDENERLALLPVFLQAVGRQAEANAALQAVTVRFADANAYWLAQNYAYRGDRELALQWLERAYKQQDIGLVTIVGEPLFKNLYDDPRFNAFLRKMKLPETPWPATGST